MNNKLFLGDTNECKKYMMTKLGKSCIIKLLFGITMEVVL